MVHHKAVYFLGCVILAARWTNFALLKPLGDTGLTIQVFAFGALFGLLDNESANTADEMRLEWLGRTVVLRQLNFNL